MSNICSYSTPLRDTGVSTVGVPIINNVSALMELLDSHLKCILWHPVHMLGQLKCNNNEWKCMKLSREGGPTFSPTCLYQFAQQFCQSHLFPCNIFFLANPSAPCWIFPLSTTLKAIYMILSIYISLSACTYLKCVRKLEQVWGTLCCRRYNMQALNRQHQKSGLGSGY